MHSIISPTLEGYLVNEECISIVKVVILICSGRKDCLLKSCLLRISR